MGSIYSLTPFTKEHRVNDVWVSKDIVFWDQIVYFNPENGVLFYYAPLSCNLFFDNTLDDEPAVPLFSSEKYCPKDFTSMDEFDREPHEIGVFFDEEEQLLYLHYWDEEALENRIDVLSLSFKKPKK